MLISETTGDYKRFAGVEYAAEVGDKVAACFEAARGAFSHNTERALRADVEAFAFWRRQHNLEAVPASAGTVDGAPLRLRHRHPEQDTRACQFAGERSRAVRPATDAPAPGALAGPGPGTDLADAKQVAGGGRRPGDRHPQPRPAGHGLRHPVAGVRAGVSGSVWFIGRYGRVRNLAGAVGQDRPRPAGR